MPPIRVLRKAFCALSFLVSSVGKKNKRKDAFSHPPQKKSQQPRLMLACGARTSWEIWEKPSIKAESSAWPGFPHRARLIFWGWRSFGFFLKKAEYIYFSPYFIPL
jgi:hypothetical protein